MMNQRNIIRMMRILLNAERYKVVGFYPYTSVVTNRLFETDYDEVNEDEEDVIVKKFFDDAMTKAEALGCHFDNKIAIELQPINNFPEIVKNSSIFVGYKDNRYSVGLSVYQPDSFTSKYNKYFN